MRSAHVIALVAVFVIVMSVGAYNVYWNDDGSYNASASMNADGTVSFTLSGPDTNYSYSVFSNTKIPDKLYLYYDDSYRSDFNDQYTQKEFLTVLQSMLERRGMSSTFVNANELVTVMDDHDSAVFFVSGALPDTVYDGNTAGTSPFVKWMTNGGTVYWTGPEIGRYISTHDAVTDHEKGFFDGDVLISDADYEYAYNQSDMFQYTQLRYDDCMYGLRADRADSRPLSYISDGGYSSVSVAKVLGGNVTVFGGNVSVTKNVSQVVTDRTCCADVVICGLTYQSEGLDHGTGTLKGSLSSNTGKDVSAAVNKVFFITVGEPASNWSKTIRL